MLLKSRLFTRRIANMRLFSKLKINTSGIIVIGDEILKGNVIDTNSNYITHKLYNLGIQVRKISVIGDCIEEISEEIKMFSKKYTYVITTGGIGPTHDDVTFEAAAKAFNEGLFYHPVLVKICSEYFKTNNLKEPCMKLAHVPQSAKLIFGNKRLAKFPLVNINNIYIFPGIPQLLEKSFDFFCNSCFLSSATFYNKEIHLQVSETVIVNILNEIVQMYPNVEFGSYPVLENNLYKVKITIECMDEKLVEEAYDTLIKTIPKDYFSKDISD